MIKVILTNDGRTGTAIQVVGYAPGEPVLLQKPESHILYGGETHTFFVHLGQQLLVREVAGLDSQFDGGDFGTTVPAALNK